jgi:mannose/fructose/N-acetylgalactosamine-specific phosphotransferase system component IIB
VDSRCIHGQIIAGWGIREQVARFILANDEVAADEWERNQYLALAGSDFETLVLSIPEAIARLREAPDARRTMVITSSPGDALRLLSAGVKSEVLTIGNLEPGPGKQQLSPTVFIDEADRAALGRILALGVKVLIMPLPNSVPIAIGSEQIADRSKQGQS